MRSSLAVLVTTSLTIFACTPVDAPTATATVSACGGFDMPGALTDRETYCAAERISWTYDSAASKLVVRDSRVGLNCCGDHDVTFTTEGDTYVLTETDVVPALGSRCRCSCVYDYETALTNITGSSASVKILRKIQEESTTKTVWTGTIDLTKPTGEIEVDKTAVGPVCEERG